VFSDVVRASRHSTFQAQFFPSFTTDLYVAGPVKSTCEFQYKNKLGPLPKPILRTVYVQHYVLPAPLQHRLNMTYVAAALTAITLNWLLYGDKMIK
jgi:hypothetical protein